MRQEITFDIEGYDKKFKVKELTVREIINLIQNEKLESGNLDLEGFKDYFSDVLPKFTNTTLDELMEMAPSDIRIIWDKFSEANKVFFEVARSAGLENILNLLRRAIIGDFGKWLASSLSQGTEES